MPGVDFNSCFILKRSNRRMATSDSGHKRAGGGQACWISALALYMAQF